MNPSPISGGAGPMKLYSASEAVWPALRRTYDYLFCACGWETFLKLAALATLSEGFLVSFRFTIPNTFPFEIDRSALERLLLARGFLPVTLLALLAVLLVVLYCIFLVTRLRFALVHSLIHQTRDLRAAWKLYDLEAERLFSATVLIGLAFFVLSLAALCLFALSAYAVVGTPTPDGKLDPGHFLFLFFPLMAIAFTLILAAWAAHVVTNDFILPHMAIEGLSVRKAWAAVRSHMVGGRETFLSYFILRLGIPLMAGLILGLLAWVVDLAVFGVLEISAAGFNVMLDGANDLRAAVLIGVRTLFVLLGAATGSVLAAVFGGPLGVFMRSYALFFYGGHYRALGNLLAPSVAAPPEVQWKSEPS
jgi:hypothetical protein